MRWIHLYQYIFTCKCTETEFVNPIVLSCKRNFRVLIHERSCARTHTRMHTHTSSLSNPSTNSPLVEGVHCFSFILISLSPFFKKIHIRFSLSWPQSEPLKQSITLLVLFVSLDLSLSMESTPLSWSRVRESQTLTLGNCFLSQAILTSSLPLKQISFALD